MANVRLIKHEAVPNCGSYEIHFPDGRPSRFIYWDDLAGRRMRPEMVDRAVAERVAKIFARAEQHMLNQTRGDAWQVAKSDPSHGHVVDQAAVSHLT
jgi:hypothetical protein